MNTTKTEKKNLFNSCRTKKLQPNKQEHAQVPKDNLAKTQQIFSTCTVYIHQFILDYFSFQTRQIKHSLFIR